MLNNNNLEKLKKALSEINCSSDSNLAKLKSVRTHFERALKYHFDIPEEEFHSLNKLIHLLEKTIHGFGRGLVPKGKKIKDKLNFYVHNEVSVDSQEFDEMLNKYIEFLRTLFEEKIVLDDWINTEDRLTKENFVANANPEISTQKYEHRTYFKISQKWYGKGKKIRTQFQTGIHQDTIFIYDHDLVYSKTQDHLKTLPCWFNHGYYSSSNNIPLWAKNHVEELA
jgi:hypothetical protein